MQFFPFLLKPNSRVLLSAVATTIAVSEKRNLWHQSTRESKFTSFSILSVKNVRAFLPLLIVHKAALCMKFSWQCQKQKFVNSGKVY